MKKLVALLSTLLVLCWSAQLFAQTVTWGEVSGAPRFVSTNGSLLSHWGIAAAPSFTSSNGTTSATWQLAAPTGPQLSNNAGVIEARNAALSAFVNVRGLAPVGANDFAIKGYVDAGLAAITIPTLTGVATTNGCLTATGGIYSWGTCGGGGGSSVTGTGIWYSAGGTLNGAAVSLSGDGTLGALSGSNLPLTLATVNATTGTFGNTTTIPVVTVNAKGLVTAVTTAAVSGTSVTGTGLWYSATGSLNAAAVGVNGDATIGALSGSSLPLTLATVNGNVGTFGSATLIPSFTVNAKGLITAVTTNTVAAALGSATGVLTPAKGGTGLTTLTAHGVVIGEGTSNVAGVVLGNTQILVGQTAADPAAETVSGDATLGATGALTLATVNATTGSFGTSSTIPVFSVNGKGLITAASSVTVAAPLASATGSLALARLTAGANGQVLQSNGGVALWNSFTGDASVNGAGTVTNTKINGASVPAAGSLVTGNGPYVSGASALTYSALNLAGGSGWVTGTLPVANLPSLAGDAVGAINANVVSTLTGSGSVVAIKAGELDWASTVTSPTITEDRAGAGVSGANIVVQAQQGGTGTTNGGGVILAGGAATGAGTTGTVELETGDGARQLFLLPTGLLSTSQKITFQPDTNSHIFGIDAATSDSTTGTLTLKGADAFGSATTHVTGGNLLILPGLGTTAANGGSLSLYSGDSTTNITVFPSLVTGHSGTNSAYTVVRTGSGARNTQVANEDQFAQYGRMSGSFGSLTAVSRFTLPTGSNAEVHCHFLARVVTAAGSANVGDTYYEETITTVKNVGGVVSTVAIPTILTESSDTVFNTSTSIVSFNNSTTPGCVSALVPNVGGSIGAATDATVWGEIVIN